MPYSRDFTFVCFTTNDAQDAVRIPLVKISDSESRESVQARRSRLPPLQRLNSKFLYEDQLLSYFLDQFLPTDYSRSSVSQLVSFTWIDTLPSLKGGGKTLSGATLALATALLGRQSGDERLVRESLSQYGKTLWQLQRDLYNPKSMRNHETLFVKRFVSRLCLVVD